MSFDSDTPRVRSKRAGLLTPWHRLAAGGRTLKVEDFPVTLIVQLGNALRRVVTTPYASQFGLSEAEWRMFTLIVNFSPLRMVDLVTLSTSDKALVSRSVKALKSKGLVDVIPEPEGSLKRLVCVHTPKGLALHARIFPIAQERQAKVLCSLTQDECDSLYRILKKLNDQFSQQTRINPRDV